MMRKHIALILVMGFTICALLWQNPPAAWTALRIAGLCLMIAGFLFWSLARVQLGEAFAIRARATELVTRGLYSKIRNPIYLFGLWIVAGAILVFLRPIWLLLFVVLIPVQLWRAKKESALLEATFQDQYRNYRSKTWF
jgi:protein-S-isoprenylcysteine O-methyltransferase Ste14